MKASRFQEQTNTSSVLMVIAAQHLEAEADIVDFLSVYAFKNGFDKAQGHDIDDEPQVADSYYDPDDTYCFVEPPTEDSWEGETSDIMPETGGVELLRWLMEGVKASEIKNKPATWVAIRYCCFSSMVVGALFNKSICDDPSQIIGRYSIAMEQRLRELGVEFNIFGGITEAGYQQLNELKKQETEMV